MQKIKNTYSRKHSIFKRELCKLVQLYYLARCESVSDNKSSFPPQAERKGPGLSHPGQKKQQITADFQQKHGMTAPAFRDKIWERQI